MSKALISRDGKRVQRLALLWACPALRRLPDAEWGEVLEHSKTTEFDATERCWILAGMALAAYLLRFDATQATALSLPIRYLAQFLVAVPLLLLIVGPVFLRRTRRGIDREIERRRLADQFDPLRRPDHD